jgi:hypothetical protein
MTSKRTQIADLAVELGRKDISATVRVAAVTAVAGPKVQTSITDTAWINRALDVNLAVGDRVLLTQQGATFVAIARLSGLTSDLIVKSKSTTGAQTVASSTTTIADLDLYADLEPGWYRVQLYAHASNALAAETADIRSAWKTSVGGAVTGFGRSCIGPASASTSVLGGTAAGSGSMQSAAGAFGTEFIYGITDDATTFFHEDLLIQVTASTRFGWYWAQGGSNASGTVVSQTSRLYVTPLPGFAV